MLLSLEELNNRPEGDRCCKADWVNKCSGRNGWNRDAAQAVLSSDLQAPAIGALQQLWFVLIAASPHWPNGMNHMSRFEVAAGCDNRITNRTTSDALAFLVNLRAAF